MQTHQENMYFGGLRFQLTEKRRLFLEDWHQSDIELCCTLIKMKMQDVILYFKREKERLGEKYPTIQDLEGRPYFLNRYLMLSIREMYNLYLPPPQN